MVQYINKDAVVAEIEKRRKEIPKNEVNKTLKIVYGNEAFVLTELLSFLDTLEVKEVDLETEIDRWLGREAFPEDVGVTPLPKAMEIVERTAKHFFELGLKASKGRKSIEFTHHENNESLEDAVAHQMEDDGDVDDFARKGFDSIALKYAKLGAHWMAVKELSEPSLPSTLNEAAEEYATEFTGPFELWYSQDEVRQFEAQHEDSFKAGVKWRDKQISKLPEWSEKDEEMIHYIIEYLERLDRPTGNSCIEWLKSLRPQKQWKPSEEQIEALENCVDYLNDGDNEDYEVMYSLLNDLKNL